MANEIYNIDIENLMHHPANPRKDIGDITELADSIKAQGVMQNLTVIPVHYFSDDWDRARHENDLLGVIEEFKDGRKTAEELLFYVLIGNRRLEASKAAGLKELPCKIVTGLSKDEQIAIMLTENMQRSDLTVQEEAIGFQQMLDFGSDIEEISNISGLSETTVRHRVNIAKLDQELVKNALDKQINLTDFIELEKISDINKRNEILKKSSDIKWAVKQEIEKQEKEKQKNDILSAIRKDYLLEEVPKDAQTWDGTWELIKSFDFEKEIDTSDLPQEELFYRESYYGISVFRRVEKKEKPEDAKRKHVEEIRQKLIDQGKIIKGKVANYIQHVMDADKKIPNAVDNFWWFILKYEISIYRALEDLTSWVEDQVELKDCVSENEYREKLYDHAKLIRFEHQLMALIFEDIDRGELISRWGKMRNEERCETLGAFIDLLQDIYHGEVITKEQREILDGTHKLYKEVEE